MTDPVVVLDLGVNEMAMDDTVSKMADQSFVDGRERLRLIGE